jgi:DNA invertase Pin-like site-specific DNA recombinase
METPKAYSYIRFSTPEQLKGDSLRRQLEASRKYAKEHDLELDESMQDLGLSGFHGINRIRGALGRFLQLVEEGKIQKGSYLIVESLDRISREEVDDAYDQFRGIIKSGITIVTLKDGMTYSKESMKSNWEQLIFSISIMARAFEESKLKSQRLSDTWENKLDNAVTEGKMLTKNRPHWLKLSKDEKHFEPRPDRVAVITLIYEKKLLGRGSQRIARELNQMDNIWKPEGKKGKPASWGISYVDRLLHNDRRLIGEFQPHKATIIDGKRKHKPIGDPIKYYPIAIDIELFNRVQAQIKKNYELKGHAGGRNDKMYNLFGNIAVCGYCGFSMLYRNKGQPPKGGHFYQCEKSYRGLKCKGTHLMYDIVEENILMFCKGLDVNQIMPNNESVATELSILQNQLQAKDGEIALLNDDIKNMDENIKKAKSDKYREYLEKLFLTLTSSLKRLEAERKKIKSDIDNKSNNGKQTEEQLKSIKELIDLMKTLDGEERLKLRLNLKNQLRRLIKTIKVHTKDSIIVIFFQSGERTLIKLDASGIPKIINAYPK